MATDRLGLYVHIPYCIRKCNYCDFCSLPLGDRTVPESYVSRLIDEIRAYSGLEKPPLSTVYFGGGTPSLLEPAVMERILLAIRKSFEISDMAEITLEANPGTLTQDKAYAFKQLGFNRVSVGLQSIHENEMKSLGRIHNFEEFFESYNTLRAAGFENVNVDLMYGIPYQTKDSFKETLDKIARLRPEHISCYGLIIEEGTPFFKDVDTLDLPSQDDECDMYELATRTLRDNGYSHYEISNYAKPGYESRHNLIYWNSDDYIGIGAAAHSYFKGVRRSNTEDVEKYIGGSGISPEEEHFTDLDEEAYVYAMLKLRLKDGFSLSEYQQRFSRSFLPEREKTLAKMKANGLLKLENDRIFLTERGLYVSNGILVEIL